MAHTRGQLGRQQRPVALPGDHQLPAVGRRGRPGEGIDRLADDSTRVALSGDVAGWADDTGLWTQMDRFLEVTARSIGAA